MNPIRQRLFLNDEAVVGITAGQITCNIRIKPRAVDPGELRFDSGVSSVDVTVTGVRQGCLADVSNEEAQAAGYKGARDFRSYWIKLIGAVLDKSVTVIWFEPAKTDADELLQMAA